MPLSFPIGEQVCPVPAAAGRRNRPCQASAARWPRRPGPACPASRTRRLCPCRQPEQKPGQPARPDPRTGSTEGTLPMNSVLKPRPRWRPAALIAGAILAAALAITPGSQTAARSAGTGNGAIHPASNGVINADGIQGSGA